MVLIATRGVADFRLPRRLLFHELVHIAQYLHLGVPRFMAEYVRGFVTGGYPGTPPEEQAFELTTRFERGEIFSVETEVRRRFD